MKAGVCKLKPFWIQAKQLAVDQVHHAESLIDLKVVHTGQREPCSLQRPRNGQSWSCGELVWLALCIPIPPYPCQYLQPIGSEWVVRLQGTWPLLRPAPMPQELLPMSSTHIH